MTEIRDYAHARGIKPATVLQVGAGLSGTAWAKWEAKISSCTLETAERLRAYMANNPAPSSTKTSHADSSNEDAA